MNRMFFLNETRIDCGLSKLRQCPMKKALLTYKYCGQGFSLFMQIIVL
jgi:hypothetical protein